MVVLEQLKMLVNLSLVDGDMTEKEKNYILNIGVAHGYPESSVETLFYSAHDVIIPEKITNDQRFEYLITLIQLSKLDHKLYQPEIKFCAQMIKKLGYRPEVMVDLLMEVDSYSKSSEFNRLKARTIEYLISSSK
jgi:hypothetical protein